MNEDRCARKTTASRATKIEVVCFVAVVCATGIWATVQFGNSDGKAEAQANRSVAIPLNIISPKIEDVPVNLESRGTYP